MYFNPRSPHGERPCRWRIFNQLHHFNPRSPHGERHKLDILHLHSFHISIHAPRTGSDRPASRFWGWRRHFNPRSPHGERRARRRNPLHQQDFNPRSPHGERRDADSLHPGDVEFQSTLPARGATVSGCQRGTAPDYFNPRSPHGERLLLRVALKRRLISIHAPRTGSDIRTVVECKQNARFQSTLPARGATAAAEKAGVTIEISIHAPRTGSDKTAVKWMGHANEISIHAPRTGSDDAARCADGRVRISIHAPRTGSDEIMLGDERSSTIFQSTLPARGATMPRR